MASSLHLPPHLLGNAVQLLNSLKESFPAAKHGLKACSTNYLVAENFLLQLQVVLKTEAPPVPAVLSQRDGTAGCFGIIRSPPIHSACSPGQTHRELKANTYISGDVEGCAAFIY